MMQAVRKFVNRFDGWSNILTNLGRKDLDKRTGMNVEWEPMDESECDDLLSGSDVARTICEDLPSEALREGYKVVFKETSEELEAAVLDEIDRLTLNEKVLEAATWARAYGGAAIIPITDDVLSLSKPLDLRNVKKIKNLLVLNKFELVAGEIDQDVRSTNFGKPLFYQINPRGVNANNQVVHYSHVIIFDGAKLPRQHYQKNKYWHDSVLNSARAAISDYESAMSSVALALQDFSIAVYKQKGLHEQIAQGDDETVIKRMQIISIARSIARAVVIDADTEEFSYSDRSFSGVNEAVEKVSSRLVVASKMPHTRILGESPTGSNATGNATTLQWYDVVAAYQRNSLTERLVKLYDVIYSQKEGPTKGIIPKGYSFEFNPLWQPTLEQETAANKSTAEADQMYIQNGVFTSEAIAKARVGSSIYPSDMVEGT